MRAIALIVSVLVAMRLINNRRYANAVNTLPAALRPQRRWF